MKAVMDSPHFQRLRGLKQLGTSEYVFMNADHNRFQHSIGVAHLSQLMVVRLKEKQPNLNITEKDVLCVTLAGLLHDIGHGPFSHVYDDVFPKQLSKYLSQNPNLRQEYQGLPDKPKGWKHEDGSNMMIDALLAHHGLAIDLTPENLDAPLKQIGGGIAAESLRVFFNPLKEDGDESSVLTSRDWVFIKEAIQGKPLEGLNAFVYRNRNDSGFVGRPHIHKEFLYDIVSNRHNGMDTDKIDYFARDERRALKGNGEVELRLIEESLVSWGSCPQPKKCFRCSIHGKRSHLMVTWPVKCVSTAANFFHQRFRNHSKIYQHKATQASTYMVSDIMIYADPFYRIKAADLVGAKSEYPEGLPISRAMKDSEFYLRLKDSIIDKIEDTDQPELKRARLLIRRLRQRDLYKCVATKKIQSHKQEDQLMFQKTEEDIAKELIDIKGFHRDSENGKRLSLTENDFIIEKASFHCGQKDKNPVLFCRFIPKDYMFKTTSKDIGDLPKAIQVDENDYETHFPKSFIEKSIRVYCRTPEKSDLLLHVFQLWCREYEDGAQDDMIETTNDDGPENQYFEIPMSQEISQDGHEAFASAEPAEELSPIRVTKNNRRHFAQFSRNS